MLTWLRDHRKEKATVKRSANYSGLRLAVSFEEFSIACADAISNSNLALSSDGHAGMLHLKLPVLQPFPEDIDWRALDVSLAARALAIRNELVIAQQGIDFWHDIDDECVPSACLDQLGLCGYRAWGIASDLRARYNVPSFAPQQFSWDVEGFLRDQHNLALERKEKKETD